MTTQTNRNCLLISNYFFDLSFHGHIDLEDPFIENLPQVPYLIQPHHPLLTSM